MGINQSKTSQYNSIAGNFVLKFLTISDIYWHIEIILKTLLQIACKESSKIHI